MLAKWSAADDRFAAVGDRRQPVKVGDSRPSWDAVGGPWAGCGCGPSVGCPVNAAGRSATAQREGGTGDFPPVRMAFVARASGEGGPGVSPVPRRRASPRARKRSVACLPPLGGRGVTGERGAVGTPPGRAGVLVAWENTTGQWSKCGVRDALRNCPYPRSRPGCHQEGARQRGLVVPRPRGFGGLVKRQRGASNP